MGSFLPQPYIFTFDNKNDYLMVKAHLKAYCTDGKIFETEDIDLNEFYYRDITKIYMRMENYIQLDLPRPHR